MSESDETSEFIRQALIEIVASLGSLIQNALAVSHELFRVSYNNTYNHY